MELGLKLWSTNINLIENSIQLIENNIFDYIELFVVPNTDINPFLIDVPYIIHIPHEKFNVNIGECSKKLHNSKMITNSINWADELNAKYLILHAGYGSLDNGISFLDTIDDNRLLIENMPKIGIAGESMIGYSTEQLEILLNDKRDLCLDLGHAIKAACSMQIDYKPFIEEFIDKFKPKMFHFSDGISNNEKDEHLKLGDGDYDLQFLKKSILKNKSQYVTMETPRLNQKSLSEDRENINIYHAI
ncbi:TIM barrel protein [Methanococcoides sp. SA1]|nr:TIM barrel protein [Methanococcoides sp. SA1]